MLYMELMDYLYFRGNWEINDFVEKELYGKQMNLVNI